MKRFHQFDSKKLPKTAQTSILGAANGQCGEVCISTLRCFFSAGSRGIARYECMEIPFEGTTLCRCTTFLHCHCHR